MPLPTATSEALRGLDIGFTEDEDLSRRVYWRVGGPADGWCEVGDVATLQAVQRAAGGARCPVFVLGKGSNLLVSDAGIRGLVVSLVGALAGVVEAGGDPPVVRTGAGLALTVLLSRASRAGWTGLECFAGVPGTVGGAVVMNAGSRLGETVEPLLDVDLVLADGRLITVSKQALQMSYRTTHLPPGSIVATARLQTTGGDARASQERMRTFLLHRKSTQPLDMASCGSTFRNPPADHAGRLIEAAGLKGFRIGDAQVSEKHANFIVNRGAATASDIRSVIEHVQDTVQARSGVALVREVHYAGEWEAWPQPARAAGAG